MDEVTVPVRAQWALWGKPVGARSYELIDCSDGPLSPDAFIEVIGRLLGFLGSPDDPPQVTVAGFRVREGGTHVAVAVHDQAPYVDPGGRRIMLTSCYVVPFSQIARGHLGYQALVERFREFDLPVPGREPIETEVPVTVPDPSREPGAGLARQVAALLLVGPVRVAGAEHVPLGDRLRFIDEVASLLPYGMRSTFSATTWFGVRSYRGRPRLFFSDVVPGEGAETVGWGDPGDGPIQHPGAEWYRDWLRENPGLRVSELARMTEERGLELAGVASLLDSFSSRLVVARNDWYTPVPPAPLRRVPAEPSPVGNRGIVDDDVRFTVYRPQVLPAEVWASLLVFVHKTGLVEVPGRAAVDPGSQVEAMARAHFGGTATPPAAADARGGIFRGAQLRVVPDLPGILCNPEDAELGWWEPVHEVMFRLYADRALAGSVVRGAVRVWCGPLLLGEVSVSIAVAASESAEPPAVVADSVQRYRKIFPSYSHADRAVVAGFAEAARALGDQYLQDVLALRTGERWGTRLLELIEHADVFQLFWSSNSMRSRYCRNEWEHALALGRPSFIRPLYWEEPLPEDPVTGLPPAALRELHFVKVRPDPVRIIIPDPPAPYPGQGESHVAMVGGDGGSRLAARPLVAAALVLLVIVVTVVLVVFHVF
jgi:TIR domain